MLASDAFKGFKLKRALHLVDIENLVAGHTVDITYRTIKYALRDYPHHMTLYSGDVMVIGIDARHHVMLHNIVKPLKLKSQTGVAIDIRVVIGHDDKNGADEAIVAGLRLVRDRTPPLTEDYGQVSFGSGDGHFVPSAKELDAMGLSIVNVIGKGGRAGSWNTIKCQVIQLCTDQPRA